MATTPGMTPGQYYAGNTLRSQGLSLGTPPNWSKGGLAMYSPQYVQPLRTDSGGQPGTVANRSNPGARPSSGGGQIGGTGQLGNAGGFTPTSLAGQPSAAGQSVFGQNPVFSPETTARSEYTIRAGADRASNLPFAMKQFDRPGVSRGAGSVAGAAAQIAGTQSQGRENAANQFVDDYMTNQRFALDAQMARERERLGLGNVQARLQEMIQRQQLGQVGGLLSMLDY